MALTDWVDYEGENSNGISEDWSYGDDGSRSLRIREGEPMVKVLEQSEEDQPSRGMVEFQWKVRYSGNSSYVGAVFRAQEGEGDEGAEYYLVRLRLDTDDSQKTVMLRSPENSVSTTIDSPEKGKWAHLRIKFWESDTIAGVIEINRGSGWEVLGQELSLENPSSGLANGALGLFARTRDKPFAIDNVKVYYDSDSQNDE